MQGEASTRLCGQHRARDSACTVALPQAASQRSLECNITGVEFAALHTVGRWGVRRADRPEMLAEYEGA